MRTELYESYFELEDKHWWFLGRRRIFLRLLDQHLAPSHSRDRRVLDVGCGTGVMIPHLERYGQARGVDADSRAVEFCRERGVSAVTQANPPPLPFDACQFDLVTALDVVEHVADDRGLVGEMARVLKPGGLLLVAVPAFQFLWGLQDEVAHHKRRYVRPQLTGLIAEADLCLLRASYFNSLLFPGVAAVRLARRLWPRAPRHGSDFDLTGDGWVNSILARVLGGEAAWLERRDLPFGVSCLALARKPLERDAAT